MLWMGVIGESYSGGDCMKKDEKKIVTDPFGSYTGISQNPYEKPVQDADDL